MQRLKAGVFAVLAGMAVAVAPAVSQAQSKVAVVDLRRLVLESPLGKQTAQKLQAEFAPKERQIEQERAALQAEFDKFQRDAATMTETDRRRTERDLDEKKTSFERKVEDLKKRSNARQNDEFGAAQQAVIEALHAYAKSAGYDLVLPINVGLYVGASTDITQQVLTSLQNQKVTPAVPKPASSAPANQP